MARGNFNSPEQIGLKKRGSEEYDFFTFEEFPPPEEINKDTYDLNAPKSLIILSKRLNEAITLLQSIGIVFNPGPSFSANRSSANDVLLEITSTIDDTVRRAMAKIAFNNLAYRILLTFGSNDLPVIVDKGYFWNVASMSVFEVVSSKQN